MALVQKRNTKRTVILTWVLISILLAGGIIYVLLRRAPSTSLLPDNPTFQSEIPQTFGEDFLHSDLVRNLSSYGNLPISADPGAGNPSPFTP